MPRGGKRSNAGRKSNKPEQPADYAPKKDLATKILDGLGKPNGHKATCKHEGKCECLCKCEECLWKRDAEMENAEGRWSRDRLWSRRSGNPVTTVNHVHDKPIDVNVNVSMAEIVRGVRKRKEEYERNRG